MTWTNASVETARSERSTSGTVAAEKTHAAFIRRAKTRFDAQRSTGRRARGEARRPWASTGPESLARITWSARWSTSCSLIRRRARRSTRRPSVGGRARAPRRTPSCGACGAGARAPRGARLAHLDAELTEDHRHRVRSRADLFAERARLVDGRRGRGERGRGPRGSACSTSAAGPPAALRGLEATLASDGGGVLGARRRTSRRTGRATPTRVEPRLAAWLQVERAAARSRVSASPMPRRPRCFSGRSSATGGSARCGRACVRGTRVVHRDAAWLVALLAEEASLEGDPARAAALELDAACVARRRLGDAEGAVALLERAAARIPIAPPVHWRDRRRAGDSLHEAAGRTGDVLRVRRLRLTHLDDALRFARARAARDRDARGDVLGRPRRQPSPPSRSAPRSWRRRTPRSSTSSIGCLEAAALRSRSGSTLWALLRGAAAARLGPSARVACCGPRVWREAWPEREAPWREPSSSRAPRSSPTRRTSTRSTACSAGSAGRRWRPRRRRRARAYRRARPRRRERALPRRSAPRRAPRSHRRPAGGGRGRRTGGGRDVRGGPSRRAGSSRGPRRPRANGGAGREPGARSSGRCSREAEQATDPGTAAAR